MEHLREAAVAAREDALDDGEARIVVVEGDGAVRDVLLEQLLAALELLDGQLAEPLERRVGFRHEAGDGDRDLAAALALDLRVEIDDLLGELSDADDVFVRLRRQAHHEVELDLLPALAERGAAGLHEVLLRHALVDDVAQALRARLRRERQAGLPHLLHLVGEVDGEAVDAQGRQREADLLVAEVRHEVIDEAAEAGVVGRRQRGQAHLVVARRVDEAAGHLAQVLFRALAGRAVADAGLAEAAAARAAAEELEHDAVVHDVHVGHDGMLDRDGVIHVADDALVDDGLGRFRERAQVLVVAFFVVLWLVERRHIDAIGREQAPQEALAAARSACLIPSHEGVRHLDDGLFALADDEEVEEVGHWLDVVDAWTAADDEWHVFTAVLRIERDAGEVEHVEHVRVDHLILQREADEVKGGDLRLRLEREERHLALAHLLLHVCPGRVDALRRDVLPAVEHFVKDGEAEVAHANLVDIRQGQRPGAVDRCMVLDDGIPFAARIARWLQDRLQYFVFESYHWLISSVSQKKPPLSRDRNREGWALWPI